MKPLSIGCHTVPYVQIEIYEGRGNAFAHDATGLEEGGRKETGNYIYRASKMVSLNWVYYCCLFTKTVKSEGFQKDTASLGVDRRFG
jgi:hypothetical protein